MFVQDGIDRCFGAMCHRNGRLSHTESDKGPGTQRNRTVKLVCLHPSTQKRRRGKPNLTAHAQLQAYTALDASLNGKEREITITVPLCKSSEPDPAPTRLYKKKASPSKSLKSTTHGSITLYSRPSRTIWPSTNRDKPKPCSSY